MRGTLSQLRRRHTTTPRPTTTLRLALLICLAGLAGIALGVAAAETEAEHPSPPTEVPVRFRQDELFWVRSQVGNLTPADRAQAIEQRLRELPPSAASEVRVEERGGSSDLYAGTRFVMSVTGLDAAPTGRTRQQLAADYAETLRGALTREGKGRSVRGVLVAVLLTVLATALLLLALRLLRQGFARLHARMRTWENTRIRTLRVQGLEVLSAERATDALIAASRLVRLALVALLVAVWANAVLGFFPWTRGVARTVLRYGWEAAATILGRIADFLPNLFYIAVIVVITRILLKAARLVASQVESGGLVFRGFYREWADPTYKIVRFLVVAFAAVVTFPYLPGSDSGAFRGVTIFLGVLFSLGSTSAVSNVVAGIVLTYMRPFAVGDRVRIAETTGDVIASNLLVVRIRTVKNHEVTLSNSMVLAAHIVNFSAAARGGGLILHTAVTIGYDTPWRKVHELLVSAAQGVDGILERPPPYVLQTALNDFHVSYELNVFTDRVQQSQDITSRLHQAIQDRFADAGVEILSPHFASLRDGNAVAVPTSMRAGVRAGGAPAEPAAVARDTTGDREPG
jgi:small-conductance mechanosensitive channel